MRDLSPTRRCRETTFSFTGVNSNTWRLSWGAISKPTPARRLSPWATPEWWRVHPLLRSVVPEPQPCVEVIPTISSWNLSTSRTISGSFPASEVTFHVPRASFRVQGSGCRGPRLRLPPDPLSTGPLRSLLQVVSPREGGPTSLLRAEHGRTRGERPGHQALAYEPQPRAWLQGGAPAAPCRATSRSLI